MGVAEIIKKIGAKNNVIMRVVDAKTGVVVSETIGHNSATNTMLTGVAHYLKGDGVLNQGHEMLSRFIPRYISLGTMGLINQDEDADGLPAGIGVSPEPETGETPEEYEIRRFKEYVDTVPGYGADGYSERNNNDREFFGLGPMYSNTGTEEDPSEAVNCELISGTFPRSEITYRVILPENQSEIPETIDVVFSAYISTGALAKFRGNRDYIFVTETGLWSTKDFSSSGTGLVAGYRITPTTNDGYDMEKAENRQKLKESILRVGKNQIVQIIWKIQIGIAGSFPYDSTTYRELIKEIEEEEKGGVEYGMTSLMNVIPDVLLSNQYRVGTVYEREDYDFKNDLVNGHMYPEGMLFESNEDWSERTGTDHSYYKTYLGTPDPIDLTPFRHVSGDSPVALRIFVKRHDNATVNVTPFLISKDSDAEYGYRGKYWSVVEIYGNAGWGEAKCSGQILNIMDGFFMPSGEYDLSEACPFTNMVIRLDSKGNDITPDDIEYAYMYIYY